MKTLQLILSLTLGFSCLQAQSIIDSKSKVSFEISNLVFSSVEGSFSGLNGIVALDAKNVDQSKFQVCLNPATINTGNEKRDDHLRNEDFFWVEKHAKICFTGTKFSALEGGRWQIQGKLEIRGISKKITVEILQKGNQISCQFTVNRLDYEVGMDYGSFTAGEEVTLKAQLQVQ